MGSINFKLVGFEELKRKLESFTPRIAEESLRSSAFAGAKVVRDAAKKSVPVRTKLLQVNIYASRRKTPKFVATYTVRVRPNVRVTLVAKGRATGKYHKVSQPARYGRFVEFGTSKMQAKPYLRPAFFNNQAQVIEAVKKGLAKAVAKQRQAF